MFPCSGTRKLASLQKNVLGEWVRKKGEGGEAGSRDSRSGRRGKRQRTVGDDRNGIRIQIGAGNEEHLRNEEHQFATHENCCKTSSLRRKPVPPEVLKIIPNCNRSRQFPIPARIEEAAAEAATSPANKLPEPTEAQKEAGNYKKGHLSLHGLDISIENPRGSVRSGVSPEGKKWETTLAHHYGYIRGPKGKDKDHLDVFIGPYPEARSTVIDQVDPKTGKFDEHKVMMGFRRMSPPVGYLSNYEPGWKGLGAAKGLRSRIQETG